MKIITKEFKQLKVKYVNIISLKNLKRSTLRTKSGSTLELGRELKAEFTQEKLLKFCLELRKQKHLSKPVSHQ